MILSRFLKDSFLEVGKCRLETKEHKGSFEKNYQIKSCKKIKFESLHSQNRDLEVVQQQNSFVISPTNNTKNNSQENYFSFSLKAEPEEVIVGGGEQFSYLNLKNKTIPVWSQEQGIGRGSDLTSKLFRLIKVSGNKSSSYLPLPVFISSLGYFCLVDSFSYIEFKFQPKATKIIIIGDFKKIELIKTKFPHIPSRVRESYFKPIIKTPRWPYQSMIVGLQGGKKRVNKIIKGLQKNNVKFNAVWVQDWSGQNQNVISQNVNWNWQVNPQLYPNIKNWIKKLNKQDIKVLGYINPFLRKNTRLYKLAHSNNFLIKDNYGQTDFLKPVTFKSGMVDLTNPTAYSWYKQIIKTNLVDSGFSGWMADFGEHMSGNFCYSNQNIPATEVHNRYIYLWNKLNYEIVKENQNLFVFHRSAVLQSLKFVNNFWTGDQLHDLQLDDGLPASALALVTSSVSGICNNHFDLGGYTTLPWKTRTKKLTLRWMELGLFSPIMRSHEGSLPYLNHQVYTKPKTQEFLSKITQARTLLADYLDQSLAEQKSLIKMPEFILKNKMWQYKYQYMFGNDILVCPPTSSEFSYFIPWKGSWVNIWTNKKAEAGTGQASIKEPVPIFYNAASPFKTRFEKLEKLFW